MFWGKGKGIHADVKIRGYKVIKFMLSVKGCIDSIVGSDTGKQKGMFGSHSSYSLEVS